MAAPLDFALERTLAPRAPPWISCVRGLPLVPYPRFQSLITKGPGPVGFSSPQSGKHKAKSHPRPRHSETLFWETLYVYLQIFQEPQRVNQVEQVLLEYSRCIQVRGVVLRPWVQRARGAGS